MHYMDNMSMDNPGTQQFVNRSREMALLDGAARGGGLAVVYGRRRAGKTAMLNHWLLHRSRSKPGPANQGAMSQAIEASRSLQLEATVLDLKEFLDLPVAPTTWTDFFSLLDRSGKSGVIVLDEFPYLVASDPSLPSIVQRWIDHRRNKGLLLTLCGSSTQMMFDIALRASSPLYGRAKAVLNVTAMGFSEFCSYADMAPDRAESFALFSIVGGIPRYWELLATYRCATALKAAEQLFFSSSAILEHEPKRVLSDEKIEGMSALSVLEAIGRGANRASEIAGRMGVSQTSLSKTLELLVSAAVIVRDTPFGTNPKDSKKSLYRIADPCMRFWFSVYSGYRTRWHALGREEKMLLLSQHTGYVFEAAVRSHFTGAMRYWEPELEFDAVVPLRGNLVNLVEIKWSTCTSSEKRSIENNIREKFARSQLSKRYTLNDVVVCDRTFAKKL
jgi:uncharacterized protein